MPSAENLFLRLSTERASGKVNYLVELTGIPGHTNDKFNLSLAHYELLLKFMQRKIEGQDWLEIKPKKDARPERSYDIHDYNQLKRLAVALLDGIFGKGCWTKEQHETPLKETLFELSDKRERKIRLKLPTANLTLENSPQ